MKTTEIKIVVHEFANIVELPINDQNLLMEARRITEQLMRLIPDFMLERQFCSKMG